MGMDVVRVRPIRGLRTISLLPWLLCEFFRRPPLRSPEFPGVLTPRQDTWNRYFAAERGGQFRRIYFLAPPVDVRILGIRLLEPQIIETGVLLNSPALSARRLHLRPNLGTLDIRFRFRRRGPFRGITLLVLPRYDATWFRATLPYRNESDGWLAQLWTGLPVFDL